MKNNITQRGFTLIEIAIVLVIIAVLMGSFISTLTTRIESSQVNETKDELEEIKQALIGYAFTNGYLPCADCIGLGCPNGANVERDGFEDITPPGGVGCDVGGATGTLPWATLAIGGGDAWNTRYRYWVDPNFTDIGGITFASTGNGVIEEPDYVTDPTGATPQNLATNVVAVVYSHGKNTRGGISADNIFRPAIDPLVNIDENENANHDTIFHSRPPTPEDAATAGGPFDDIVIWISEYELKAKMVEAGVLP
jgi:prepilin-type N-terminal cleavage/methylation domain-containing protein